MTQKKPEKKKPGPAPEHLKIENISWENAMAKAIKKKRPKEGWPTKDKENPNT